MSLNTLLLVMDSCVVGRPGERTWLLAASTDRRTAGLCSPRRGELGSRGSITAPLLTSRCVAHRGSLVRAPPLSLSPLFAFAHSASTAVMRAHHHN